MKAGGLGYRVEPFAGAERREVRHCGNFATNRRRELAVNFGAVLEHPRPRYGRPTGVSVRRWTRSVVGLEFRRHKSIWSLAITHEHGLIRPELGEAGALNGFHMHKNIGRLGTTGQKANPRSRLNHFTTALSQSLSGATTTWVRCCNSEGRIAVESSIARMLSA